MQACLLRGSSLHLCLKAGQLSVVTITRRCRCCLDEVIILRVLFYINTASIIIFNKNTKGMILKLIYFCKECCYAQKNISKGGGMSNENEFFAEMHRKRTARTVLTGMCYSVGSVMRQGSSSLTRLTGQSAMTSRTWRR